MSEKETISVVMPVFNEEKYLEKLLKQLMKFHLYEIIIVDGGSTDRSIKIASEFSEIKLLFSEKGRAIQMNAGAREASGEILFFIHADSFIDVFAFNKISQVIGTPHVLGGSFYLKFDQDNLWLRFYSRFSRINHSFFTYGDQGLFILRQNFEALGGYPMMDILEDFELQRRIRKNGRFVKLPYPITTSARRYKKNGIISQQLKNIIIVALYLIGIPTSKLVKLYY